MAQVTDTTPGKKNDDGKHQWDLFPWVAAESVVDVLGFGAKKYGAHNWRGVASIRYFSAAIRHLSEYAQGEIRDPESGLPHLAHAACSILFMLAKDHGKTDDEVLRGGY